jgi:hypothetical protein
MRRTGKNEERTLKRVAKSLLAVLTLSGLIALSSCNDNLGPEPLDPGARVLTVRVTVPGMPATKAQAGDVTGVDPESMIYSVQVWMFNHQAAGETDKDGQQAVSYGFVNLSEGWANTGQRPSGYYDQWTNQTTYEIAMPIPSYIFDRDENDMKFDFYVLANGPSIGNPMSKTSTRGELKVATFGKKGTADYFGVVEPMADSTALRAINGGSQSGPGLPISGFFNRPRNDDGTTATTGDGVDLRFLKNIANMSNDDIKKLVPVVQITRAVSKLRFVFAKPKGMQGVSITKIVVDKDLIPDSTFVFPRENGAEFLLPTGVTYGDSAIIGSLISDDIIDLLDPTLLRSDAEANVNKTAQAYETMINDSIANKQSTQRLAYLRESDKAITGKIYYKLSAAENAEEKVATFSMANLENTDFHRNHSWLVYSYFQGGKLYVNPTIADWVDVDTLSYSLKMNTSMRLFDSWLYRYDTDGDYADWTDWATSHMAVSSGRATASAIEPIAGRPLRSPQIQLITTGDDTFELRVDNSDFEIVRANKNATGVVTSYDASTNGVLTINPATGGGEVYTYFYIVPKEGVTPSNPVAKVSLIYNDSVLGPQKVTFNYSSLPGYSDDSSEIWAYYFSIDEYNATGKLRMYFQDYNNPLVPVQ